MSILVTGANGQLGKSLQYVLQQMNLNAHFLFTDRTVLNVMHYKEISNFFAQHKPKWCLNFAAYTGVDKAENDLSMATMANVDAPRYLAIQCQQHQTKLIHISTDFVFDGNKNTPYHETEATFPINRYGQTKRNGELAILEEHDQAIILRTSWLYSNFGNNFFNTMVRLSAEKSVLNVVYDQIGTPTFAHDLARAVVHIIQQEDAFKSGIYHYSNEGVASWYDLAYQIIKLKKQACMVNPIESHQYPTPAKRPAYSVLDKTKFKQQFNLTIPHWLDSLEHCVQLY